MSVLTSSIDRSLGNLPGSHGCTRLTIGPTNNPLLIQESLLSSFIQHRTFRPSHSEELGTVLGTMLMQRLNYESI